MRLKFRRPTMLLGALSLALIALGADSPKAPPQAGDMPLVLDADFETADTAGWAFTDAKAWRVAKVEGRGVLEQFRASQYEPKVRSPFNIALAETVDAGDFVLDLKVRSTGRDYGHRDVCLFFNHVDPSHFYYVHLGKEADPHAHSIFLVNGEPRVSIAEERTKGTPWTDGWHHVRIVRETGSGLIAVYFDDMDKPIMKAHDKSFQSGKIGVGTFDDTGQFDDVHVWARKPAR